MGGLSFGAAKHNPNPLKVATLNYCGIAYSPFEFYSKQFQHELNIISSIFTTLIPLYCKNFSYNYQWEMGKLQRYYKKGRYSNSFSPIVGVENQKLVNQNQFEIKWDQKFNSHKNYFKFEWTEEQRKRVRLYDFIMYHTLLVWSFKTFDFNQAIKHKSSQFVAKIDPFFKLSFLNQEQKLAKFETGFNFLKADIFFIQQYSTVLCQSMKKRADYEIIYDQNGDSMIMVRKATFYQKNNMDDLFQKLKKEQKEQMKWAESITFASFDNYIIISAHLSSKKQKNQQQLAQVVKDLQMFKAQLPEYDIILGGDLNSFLDPKQLPSSKFCMFPSRPDMITTYKKRTASQAQFKKSELTVRESKDKIVSTVSFSYGEIRTMDGFETINDQMIPSNKHPFDHFLCITEIRPVKK